MKGLIVSSAWLVFSIISLFLVPTEPVHAQQNNTLFFMHSLPEANYVNPAVQINCGVFIGLPVISSFHANLANSGFTLGKLLTFYTDGTVRRKTDMQIAGFPAQKYFLSEFHSVLLAAGLKRKDKYYTFTITEKDNSMLIYTPDLVTFILRGSGDFEGEVIGLNGTRTLYNHVREYAFGISKQYNSNLTLGVKVKLLFGKFNFSTGKSKFGFRVEENSLDILFDIDGKYNSSLPWALQQQAPDAYRYEEVYEAPLVKHLMNARNPGLALDFGFIYKYDDLWTYSGSLLDFGFMWYRSNLSNFSIEGNEVYQGPFGDGTVSDRYLWDVFDGWTLNMSESVTADPYMQFLDPKLYLGASRKLNDRYDLNFLLYNRLLPGKLQSGVTISVLTRPDKAFRSSLSWSYMNNSPFNLGLGLSYGRRPLQLYFVSDNIFGFILPLSTKNVNLRLGINLNLGCREIFNIDQCGCDWMKTEHERKLRKDKFRRGK